MNRARILRYMLASLLALCFLTTACRAPGEPPTHPGTGVYRDLIRRETDSAHTALATTKLLIRTAQTQGLPQTYARVTLRSISGDLHNVVVDLNQIHPPTAAIKPQGRLSTIAAQDAVLVTLLQRHWDDRALQTAVLRQVGRHADEIANILSAQLQH